MPKNCAGVYQNEPRKVYSLSTDMRQQSQLVSFDMTANKSTEGTALPWPETHAAKIARNTADRNNYKCGQIRASWLTMPPLLGLHGRLQRQEWPFFRCNARQAADWRLTVLCWGRGGALVGLVNAAEVGADHVGEAVLGAAAIGRVVGQQQSHATQAEDAVCDQHGALVAVVQVHQNVLCARNDDAHIAIVLRKTCTEVQLSNAGHLL